MYHLILITLLAKYLRFGKVDTPYCDVQLHNNYYITCDFASEANILFITIIKLLKYCKKVEGLMVTAIHTLSSLPRFSSSGRCFSPYCLKSNCQENDGLQISTIITTSQLILVI